jgi:hypothetical protein
MTMTPTLDFIFSVRLLIFFKCFCRCHSQITTQFYDDFLKKCVSVNNIGALHFSDIKNITGMTSTIKIKYLNDVMAETIYV